MIPDNFAFHRYLAAKKSIDDRALNGHVWQTMARLLPASSSKKPLRVLEAGAGIGTMLERMMDSKLISYATYTAVDAMSENKSHASRRLREWSDRQGLLFTVSDPGYWEISGKRRQVSIRYKDGDVFDLASGEQGKYDLLIANAFLDLVDISAALPSLLNMLDTGGIFYFSINFDGATILEPVIDEEFDQLALSLYHRSMDERTVNGKSSGDSRAGRHLFSNLQNAGAQIYAAGGSDWVVYAGPEGYPLDEAYFLHFIVNDIGNTLKKYPGPDQKRLEEWIAERHGQIETGDLVYIAHQLDVVGKINKRTA